MRNLNWEIPEDLCVMANCVEQSIDSSMRYLNHDCPTSCLKLRPTYVTKNVATAAQDLLKNTNTYALEPTIVLDIDAHKVEMALVFQYGSQTRNTMISDKWQVYDASSYTDSGEKFFGNIADYCFKMCSQFSRDSNGYLSGKMINCTIIYRFEFDQISLTNSRATKFSKNFQVENCQGRDLVALFNEQLTQRQTDHSFQIKCTNLINSSTGRMMGLCMVQQDTQPDLLILVNQGINACFFADGHDVLNFENDTMLIGAQICNFGISIGSLEHNLLTKFLGPIDYEINNAQSDQSNLFGKFVAGVRMCEIVWRYIIKVKPDVIVEFPLFKDPKAIREVDISNLLLSYNCDEKLESRLVWIYESFDEPQKEELIRICKIVAHRSAKMMAAVSFGIMKSIYHRIPRNKIVLALEGCVMMSMHQYKSIFKETLNQLQIVDNASFEIEYVEAECSDLNLHFGAATLCKYIGNYC